MKTKQLSIVIEEISPILQMENKNILLKNGPVGSADGAATENNDDQIDTILPSLVQVSPVSPPTVDENGTPKILRPSVKRRVFGPYKPYKAPVSRPFKTIDNSNVLMDTPPESDTQTIPLSNDLESKENCVNGNVQVLQREDIDFAVERCPYRKKLRKSGRMSVSAKTEIASGTESDVEEILAIDGKINDNDIVCVDENKDDIASTSSNLAEEIEEMSTFQGLSSEICENEPGNVHLTDSLSKNKLNLNGESSNEILLCGNKSAQILISPIIAIDVLKIKDEISETKNEQNGESALSSSDRLDCTLDLECKHTEMKSSYDDSEQDKLCDDINPLQIEQSGLDTSVAVSTSTSYIKNLSTIETIESFCEINSEFEIDDDIQLDNEMEDIRENTNEGMNCETDQNSTGKMDKQQDVDQDSENAESKEHQKLHDHSNMDLLKMKYNISPLKIVLTDIMAQKCTSSKQEKRNKNTKHAPHVTKLNLNKRKANPPITLISKKKVKLTEFLPSQRIINITTNASLPSVCESFEEVVAKKLAEKIFLQGFHINENTSIEHEKELNLVNNKEPLANSHCSTAQKITTNTESTSKDDIDKDGIQGAKTTEFSSSKDVSVMNSGNSLSDQGPVLTSSLGKLKANASIHIFNLKNLLPKSGSSRRKISLPKKSLSPTKDNSSFVSFIENAIHVSPNDDTSLTESASNVPMHPSLRMKMKSIMNCSCSPSECSHRRSPSPVKSPTPVDLTSPVIPFVSYDIKKNTMSNSTSVIASPVRNSKVTINLEVTENDNHLARLRHLSTIFNSKALNCSCNIVNCPHIKTPSPTKSPRRILNLSASPSDNRTNKSLGTYDSRFQYRVEATPSPRKQTIFRPSLLPKASPNSPRSLLGRSISSAYLSPVKLEHGEIKEEFELIDLDSEISQSQSHYSSCEESIMPIIVHISSDSELEFDDVKAGNVKEEQLFVPAIAEELRDSVKKEFSDAEETMTELSFDDDDDMSSSTEHHRRRRKTASNKRVESFVVQKTNIVLPTLLKASEISLSDQSVCKRRMIKSVSKRQMLKLIDQFKLKNMRVKLMKLDSKTTERLIKLYQGTWNDKKMLKEAGLSQYDIDRLGVSTMRRELKNSKYGFRKFLKKRDIFQSMLEQPKAFKKPLSREQEFMKAQKKKMKEFMRAREEEERQKRDLESVRRSLLKINARILNQTKFWNFLIQGSSAEKPIEI